MVSEDMRELIEKHKELQWSHVFSDMVRSKGPRGIVVAREVLQWSHVFSDMVRAEPSEMRVVREIASMEPCLFRHGKRVRGGLPWEIHQLQWSHVFSDMVSGTE